jgi:2-methylcitrate dehydratase PrpD
MTAGITETITDFVVDLGYSDIPDPVRESARIFTLEAIGHMLSGLRQPVGKIVAEYARSIGGAEQSVVVGAGFRTGAAEAAYVNGTLAHADELEAYGPLPGTGLVPPIAAGLAVGEWVRGTRFDAYVAAMVAGVEMQGRLGAAALGAPDRGFMGFSLVGPAGAGVAAGRLLGLSKEQMRNCLGAALPLAGGSLRGCGYMTHVHEAGVPARVGVSSAVLAAHGFTACPDYLDGEHSWGEQFATGGRGYHPEKITENLGAPFFLAVPGSAPKRYGTCGLTHLAIEGLMDIITEHGLDHWEIASVDLLVPPFASRVAAFEEPVTADQAKFSIRQGVAGILLEGIPELPYTWAFSDEASREPRFVAARERVRLIVDDTVANVRGFSSQTVTAILADGRRITKVVEGASIRGREAAPCPLDERLDMFRNVVRGVLDDDRAERVIDLVMIGESAPVSELAALIAG